ncbi:MAG TPA: DUF4265 domain-containing protein [Bacteroidia bacterium]|nr:DUF4265 domain-containing protein [Bacteroidia bacterium]
MSEKTDNQVKILFRFYSEILDEDLEETVLATVFDSEKGLYELDTIPFYASLVAYDDLVYAEYDNKEQMLVYQKTIEHSSNSTVQVVMMDDQTPISNIQNVFNLLGCNTVNANDSFFIMKIAPEIDYKIIKGDLDKLEKAGVISYAEPCLSDVHKY